MSLIIKKNTTFKIPRTLPLRIVISGAGNASANGEYAWDGSTINNGKRVYAYEYAIQFEADNYWYIYDSGNDQFLYKSADLITWTTEPSSTAPPPSATLYYTP